MKRDMYVGVSTARVEVAVQTTKGMDDSFAEFADQWGEVTLGLRTGAAHVQTYLTPAKARELSDMLRAVANSIDGYEDDLRDEARAARRLES